ncbi:ABC transporter ATP-binding protein [Clostridia bacterium]|nr:ABC transporter ATP-binding protein [Clostridia bacterium]
MSDRENAGNAGGTLLEVRDLQTMFYLEEGAAPVIDGVSFHIRKGETLGIVGESGCGKSVMALSILRLVPSPPGKIVGGDILLDGDSLLAKSKAQMRSIRGSQIAMVFQEPMTSLNPVMPVGKQVAETLRTHQRITAKEAREQAIEMLRLVRIPLPELRFGEYPHQLSGGMRQRAMIALALSCHPKLLICDEPTTALDVTVQAQVLRLIADLQKSLHMSVMLITHDLGVISQMADRVIVMYAGQVVESGPCVKLMTAPVHPYTQALLASVPSIRERDERPLYVIRGMVPQLLHRPKGCLFAPRCDYAVERCQNERPELTGAPEESVRCFRFDLKGGIGA